MYSNWNQRVALHIRQCPCFSSVPEATYEARTLRASERQHVTSKGPSRVQGLEEGTEDTSVLPLLVVVDL